MSKVLRMTDRIKLTIGDVIFTLAPIDYLRKQELSECTRMHKGDEIFDLLKARMLYIKYALKGIYGLKTYDDKDYELQFEGDFLTDACVSEILNIEQNEKLMISGWQLLNGVKELQDPITGKELEGVKLEVSSTGK